MIFVPDWEIKSDRHKISDGLQLSLIFLKSVKCVSGQDKNFILSVVLSVPKNIKNYHTFSYKMLLHCAEFFCIICIKKIPKQIWGQQA